MPVFCHGAVFYCSLNLSCSKVICSHGAAPAPPCWGARRPHRHQPAQHFCPAHQPLLTLPMEQTCRGKEIKHRSPFLPGWVTGPQKFWPLVAHLSGSKWKREGPSVHTWVCSSCKCQTQSSHGSFLMYLSKFIPNYCGSFSAFCVFSLKYVCYTFCARDF